jgi:RimJ/RimL family protein N-acetyltransferase
MKAGFRGRGAMTCARAVLQGLRRAGWNPKTMAHVRLRPIRVADADTCFGWLSDPDVARYLGLFQPPTTVEAERAWIARVVSDEEYQRVFVIEDESGRAIGTCGLRGIDREAGSAFLGIMIGDTRVWDRGYGTAATRDLVALAFASLNLQEVRLSCHADNRRALRCYRKVGFAVDSDHRDPGVYGRAEVRMVINHASWQAQQEAGEEDVG